MKAAPRRSSLYQGWARAVALLLGASFVTGTMSLIFVVRLVNQLNDAAERADVVTVHTIGMQAITLVATLSGITIVTVFLLARVMRRIFVTGAVAASALSEDPDTDAAEDDASDTVEEPVVATPAARPDTRVVATPEFRVRLDNLVAAGSCGLLLVSLDDLSIVVGAFGEHAGRQLERTALERLRDSVRSGDSVAHLHEGVFGVLIGPPTARASALAASERIRMTFDDLFVLDAGVVQPSLSIGVAVRETEADRPDDLLRHAEIAQRCACEWATDVEFFDPARHGHRLAGSVAPPR